MFKSRRLAIRERLLPEQVFTTISQSSKVQASQTLAQSHSQPTLTVKRSLYSSKSTKYTEHARSGSNASEAQLTPIRRLASPETISWEHLEMGLHGKGQQTINMKLLPGEVSSQMSFKSHSRKNSAGVIGSRCPPKISLTRNKQNQMMFQRVRSPKTHKLQFFEAARPPSVQ